MVNRCKTIPTIKQLTNHINLRTITLGNGFQPKTTETDNVLPKLFKKTQGYCQPTKESICYNLLLHTHDEDHFHHTQILK